MRFVDQAQITVKAGDGGRGCPSFAQPPYTRYPYPDGGDGGDGGDVILLADSNIATLLDFYFRHEFTAGRGGHGGSNKKSGKRGDNFVIRVPTGTLVLEAKAQLPLCDLVRAGTQVVIAKGGKGGLGNATASEALPGMPGEERRIVLELKLIADVGIVGFPNAGKSSLLARISTARPKVGAYPFTTRYPVLGVVNVHNERAFVACDIPGLIEGAHAGKGLGFQFLRHIERTRILIHLIDAGPESGRDPIESFHKLNAELKTYSDVLAAKPQVIAANKIDVSEARENAARLEQAVKQKVWPISCATGEGIPRLLQAAWASLKDTQRPTISETNE